MTVPFDLERAVSDWLRSRASASGSERVLADALAEVATERQDRRVPAWWGPEATALTWRAVVAAAAVIVVLVAIQMLPSRDGGVGVGGSPSSSSTVGPARSASPGGEVSRNGYLVPGREPIVVEWSLPGLRVSFEVPPGMWEGHGRTESYISASSVGPQGAEAKLFWTTIPAKNGDIGECWYLRNRNLALQVARPDPPSSPSMDDLVAAVADVPGTDVISGPDELTVGGHPARYVEFLVRDDVGCDPGFFFVYENVRGGAEWPETVPGDTIRVWIVDLGWTRFFIEGATHEDAGPELIQQVHQIVESIQFE